MRYGCSGGKPVVSSEGEAYYGSGPTRRCRRACLRLLAAPRDPLLACFVDVMVRDNERSLKHGTPCSRRRRISYFRRMVYLAGTIYRPSRRGGYTRLVGI